MTEENQPEPEKQAPVAEKPKIENSLLVTAIAMVLITALFLLLDGLQFLSNSWWWMTESFVLIASGVFYRKRELIVSGIVVLTAALIVFSSATIFSLTFDVFRLGWFEILVLIGFVSYLFSFLKIIETKDLLTVLTLFLIISIATSFYFFPSTAIARTQGTVLSPNWWEALNWIKNNTAECATIATYWDPGHFITAIAERPVVYDGASQGSLRTIVTDEIFENQGLEEINYEKGIVQLVLREDGKIMRARMKDMAITLFTSNESQAIEYLKDYVKPGCDEIYFIASSDLISKSQWWTYFATWSPTKQGTCPTLQNPKGDCYFYSMISLDPNTIRPTAGAIAYEYPTRRDQAGNILESFVLLESNDTFMPYLKQANNLFTVEKLFFYKRTGEPVTIYNEGADVSGLLWLTPDRGLLIFIPTQLEDALFTRMYFFEGFDLEHFEFVNNWGGEVKLFKVNFD